MRRALPARGPPWRPSAERLMTWLSYNAARGIVAAVVILLQCACSAEEPVLATPEGPRMLQEQGAGEGPAWHPELGLLTSGGGHIYRRDRGGKVSIYREN